MELELINFEFELINFEFELINLMWNWSNGIEWDWNWQDGIDPMSGKTKALLIWYETCQLSFSDI